VGDFNEVLHANEQFGGVGSTKPQMEGFWGTMSICGFTDLDFIGISYI